MFAVALLFVGCCTDANSDNKSMNIDGKWLHAPNNYSDNYVRIWYEFDKKTSSYTKYYTGFLGCWQTKSFGDLKIVDNHTMKIEITPIYKPSYMKTLSYYFNNGYLFIEGRKYKKAKNEPNEFCK